LIAYDNPDPELIDFADNENDVTTIKILNVTTASSSTDHHNSDTDDDIETIKIGLSSLAMYWYVVYFRDIQFFLLIKEHTLAIVSLVCQAIVSFCFLCEEDITIFIFVYKCIAANECLF